MRIEAVQLENIRSHVKSTVPFMRGFNCLVGALGCGKSSILYGIDFALFGEPITRSFDYLLREGAESGRIVLQFTQSGQTYRIIRGVLRRGKGINQNVEELKLFENDTLLASMKTDAVTEQLKAITGLDKDLWREIVWIRQEHLKELIDATPRERQTRLDGLFGLSDYEKAWSNVAEYKRDYEIERKILEKDPDVAGMEKLCAEYNLVTEEFTLLEIQLQDAVAKLGRSKRVLEDSDSILKKMEEKRLAAENLKRKEAQLQTELVHTKEALKKLQENIDGKKTVLTNLRQRQKSIEEQEQASRTNLERNGIYASKPLEILCSALERIDHELSNARAEKEATTRNMQADERRADSLSLEQRCPLCLQPLDEEYKNALQNRIREENAERKKSLEQYQSHIEILQKRKNIADEAYSMLQMLESKKEDVVARTSEELTGLDAMNAEMGEKHKSAENCMEKIAIVRGDIARFSLEELEIARNQREQAFRQYYVAESELRTKENQRKTSLSRMDEIKERVDLAQQKLEHLGKINQTIEVINNIRDAYRSIQPKLRCEFVRVLRNFVQQILDNLAGETPLLNISIDETYTPYVQSENAVEREVANLSGGERTLLAFAYRLGLGQLIMQSRTGHGLSILLLDEPTESLGREDGSIDRLAESISRFKAIEQIIAVTHSEAFAEKAEHVVTLEKEVGISQVSIKS